MEKSVGKKVKEFLGELLRGKWRGYYNNEEEDVEPEENDPRFKLKWRIEIDDEDAQGG